MKRMGEAGFSTLEVIAAVAIIAVALIPMASLQTQLARGGTRLVDAQETTSAVQNAMAIIRAVNPMLTPSGRRDTSDRTVLTWSSTPISPVRPSVTPAGFEVQLFRVHAEIARETGTVNSFEVDLIGWRPTSEAAP